MAFLLNLHFSQFKFPGYEMFIVLYINNINLFIMFFYFQNVHSKMIKKHSTEQTVRVLILCHMVSVVSVGVLLSAGLSWRFLYERVTVFITV